MSSRTQALMVKTPIKAQQVALNELSEEVRATRPGFAWTLDLERARLVTESYRQTENEPMMLRRAKALAHILDNMTIYIRQDEMIVGNYASNSDSVPFYPELSWKWIKRETSPGQVYECMLSDEGREELDRICEYAAAPAQGVQIRGGRGDLESARGHEAMTISHVGRIDAEQRARNDVPAK